MHSPPQKLSQTETRVGSRMLYAYEWGYGYITNISGQVTGTLINFSLHLFRNAVLW